MTFQTKRLSTGKFYYRMNKQSHLIHHQDGYYYYDAPVLEGKKIPVLEKICIPENWEKPVCFQIDLTVHAVQASWLTPRFGADCRMLGWIPTERLLKLGWINDI